MTSSSDPVAGGDDPLTGGDDPLAGGGDDPLAEPAQIVTRLSPDGAATVGPRLPGSGAAPTTDPTTKTDTDSDAGSVEATAGPADAAAAPPPVTAGAFTAYSIGDPGRAFTRTRPAPAVDRGVVHDTVIDAAVICDPGGTERLVLRGASGRGLSHQQYGDPRQDDIAYTISPDGVRLVCVVADGVSSGAWSHVAARIATEEGAAHVAKLAATTDPAQIDWHGVLTHLADRIIDAATTLPGGAALSVDATAPQVAAVMATTIVIGVVGITPGADGTHRLTVVRHGDTSAWLLDDEDGWVALGDVKNAGAVIAESATACLPLVPADAPVVVESTLGADSAFLLLTDGIGDPLGSGRGEVGAVLARQWARPPHPIEFAAQVCFGRKTYDDDRGAIGIWPVQA